MIRGVEDEFLPRDWTTVSLKTIVTKLVDGSHNPPSKRESGVPMLSARNVLNNQIVFEEYRLISEEDFEMEHARTRISPGDVLLTIVGTIGRSAVVPASAKRFALQRSVAVITPTGVLPKYLMYQFQAPFLQRHFEKNARGTAQKGVYLRTLSQTPILVAPLGQQERIIAEIEKQFSRLDEAIANLKRVKANLKRYKSAVLKAAVEGKLTEDWRKQHPDVESASTLLERILAERRAKWEARGQYKEPSEVDISELPTLANGWTWTTVDALTISGPQNGLYLPQSLYGAGIPILRIDDFQDGWSRVSDELQKVRASQAQVRAYCLDENDFVINRVNSPTHLGKALVVRQKHLPALFESNMMRLKLSTHVQTAFIAYYLQSVDGRRRLTKNAKWAVNQASINQTDVGMTELPLPPFEEQQCIVNEVERRLSIVEELEATVEANLTRADRLRQSILATSFSGRLMGHLG